MTDFILVQASNVLLDTDVITALPSLAKWARLLTDAFALPAARLDFISLSAWQVAPNAFPAPVFLNRHSTDPLALGFHATMNGKPYGRSFAGDDLLDRISPWVTLSHEVGEIIINGMIDKFFTDRLGNRYPMEDMDAVEDDIQAIVIDNIPFSNQCLPSYWDDRTAHAPGTKFDYQGRLSGPCPALTPGGYLGVLRHGAASWTQITEMHLGSRPRPSVRSQRFHGSLRHRQLETIGAIP
jgi:hypothetical protein